MDRLTFDGNFCEAFHCPAQFSEESERCPCDAHKAWEKLKAVEGILGSEYDLDHLRDLIQAEKEGRLVVLPCNIRQPLYILKSGEIHRNYGCQWHFTGKESQAFGTLSLYGEFVSLDDFGKTVFLTREEAEAALKGCDEK